MENIEERRIYLLNKFSAAPPDEETLLLLEQKLAAYEKLKTELRQESEYQTKKISVQQPKSSNKIKWIISFIGLLIVFGSFAFWETDYTTALYMVLGGLGLLMVGVIFDYIGVFDFSSAPQEEIQIQKNPVWLQKNEEKEHIEDFVKSVLFRYGYFSGNGFAEDFKELREDVEDYKRLFNA